MSWVSSDRENLPIDRQSIDRFLLMAHDLEFLETVIWRTQISMKAVTIIIVNQTTLIILGDSPLPQNSVLSGSMRPDLICNRSRDFALRITNFVHILHESIVIFF